MATVHSTVASRAAKHDSASPGQQQKHVLAALDNTLLPVLAIIDIGTGLQEGSSPFTGWTLRLCLQLISRQTKAAIRRVPVSGKAQEHVAQALEKLHHLDEYVEVALSDERPDAITGVGAAIEGLANSIGESLNRAARVSGIGMLDFCIGHEERSLDS